MTEKELAAVALRLGELVAARRKSFDATQEDLADLAEVSRRSISALESGKTTTRLDIVLRVFAALGIDVVHAIENR